MFNNSCTICLVKPAWCTHTHKGLSNSTKSVARRHGDLGDFHMTRDDKTKQTAFIVDHVFNVQIQAWVCLEQDCPLTPAKFIEVLMSCAGELQFHVQVRMRKGSILSSMIPHFVKEPDPFAESCW